MSAADTAKEYRQEFADDTAEWEQIRREASIDMRHVAGDPWEPEDRTARENAGRPCLTLDELGQYTNQVVNEVRANKRAVKFTPVGDGANDDTAEFYQNKMREIEYRSRADIAYTTAFENAVHRSYGFARVATRYEHARSPYQDIWIDPVHNPDLITPDPYALMPDMSDMKRCWVREPWSVEDFNATYPKHKIKPGTRQHRLIMEEATSWVTDRQVWLAERWKIRTKKRTLLVLDVGDGQVEGIFEDEIPAGTPVPGRVVRTREVDDPSVYQCIFNGVDVLEEKPWKGRYIPIVACVGKILFVDQGDGAKRQIHSMIRQARGPFMAYCFYRTCEIENVGMTTKNPYWAYEGQLSNTQMTEIAKSLHEPVAVLTAKPTVPAMPNQLLPLPLRNVSEPAIQALSMGAEEMRRGIQAAMGQTPLPTQAQRRNEKSGVALKRIEEAGQRGSYHFTDHYLGFIQHVGVIIEDLMPHIYDTARDVGIRKANDTAEIVRINDPSAKKPVSTKGAHLVTVSTGPSFESEREAASDFADTLAQISPELFAVLGPLIVKLKNLGPIGDEMIELLEALQPPPVQALRASKQEEADPAQAQQQIVQLKAQLQQVMEAAQKMQQELETDAKKQEATIAKAKMDAETSLAVARMAEQTKIAIAKINALGKPQIEGEIAKVQSEVDLQHDIILADVEHAHDLELEKAKAVTARLQLERSAQIAQAQGDGDKAHEHAMAHTSHQHALESGDQAVAGKLAVEKAKPKPKPKDEASA